MISVPCAVNECLHDLADPLIAVVIVRCTVCLTEEINLIDRKTEDDIILTSDKTVDLNGRTVKRTECDCAVHHELHVSGAAGFLAGSGNLFGNIRTVHQGFGHGNAVVRQEHHLQHALYIRIAVDLLRDAVDQLDDLLGKEVCRCCFRRKDIGMRIDPEIRVFLDPLIEIDYMHDVEQLTLVCMQTLCLGIEDGVYIHFNTGAAADIGRKNLLAFLLDLQEFVLNLRIIDIVHQFFDLLEILFISLADGIIQQFLQLRVAVKHPAARCNTVGLVLEPLREHLIVLFEQGGLQQSAVHFRDTVYGMGHQHRKTGHVNDAVVDDAGVIPEVVAVRETLIQIMAVAAVDLIDDHVDTRQKLLHVFHRPLLERFAHDGMVCIGHDCLCDLTGRLPLISVVIHQDTHQFRNCKNRMGIVQLNRDLLRKVVQRFIALEVCLDDRIDTGTDKEVLLLETQVLSFYGGVIRVDVQTDIIYFLQVFAVVQPCRGTVTRFR